MKINIPRPITIIDTVLVVAVGLFGNQVSQQIKMSPYFVLACFVLLLCALNIVKLWPDFTRRNKEMTSRASNDEKSHPSFKTHRITSTVLSRAPLAFGILIGLVVAVVLSYLVSGKLLVGGIAADYFTMEFVLWNNWVVADLIGIVIIVLATFRFEYSAIRSFAIGYGLGLVAANTTTMPNQISLVFTLLITPPLFFLCAFLGKGSTKLWRNIALFVLILIGIIILFMAPPRETQNTVQGSYDMYYSGVHTIYYERPFQLPPYLTLTPSIYDGEDPGFRLLRQEADHFELQVSLRQNQSSLLLYFNAKGIPRKDP